MDKVRLMVLLKALRDESFKMGFASTTGRMRDLDFHHDRVEARLQDIAMVTGLDPVEASKWSED